LALFSIFFLTACQNKQPQTPENTISKIDEKNKNYQKFKERSQNDGYKLGDLDKSGLQNILEPYLGTRAGGDCSGFVEVVNKKLDYAFYKPNDLSKHYTNSRKSKAMHNYYAKKGAIFSDKLPEVGDLVFFHNTVRPPKNLNKNNITHVGIVYDVERDGTVKFANFLSGENKISSINLNKKVHMVQDKEINSYIRKCKRRESRDRCLAYGLFAGFAKTDAKNILFQASK